MANQVLNFLPVGLDLDLYNNDGAKIRAFFRDKTQPNPDYPSTSDEPYLGFDVSDRAWTSQWRRTRDDDSFIAFEIDDSDASTGVVWVIITAEIMTQLDLQGQWDLQGQLSGQDPKTVLSGIANKTRDVTRP